MSAASNKLAFALDGLIRSRTKGDGGEAYAYKCIHEISEAIDELMLGVPEAEPTKGLLEFVKTNVIESDNKLTPELFAAFCARVSEEMARDTAAYKLFRDNGGV